MGGRAGMQAVQKSVSRALECHSAKPVRNCRARNTDRRALCGTAGSAAGATAILQSLPFSAATPYRHLGAAASCPDCLQHLRREVNSLNVTVRNGHVCNTDNCAVDTSVASWSFNLMFTKLESGHYSHVQLTWIGCFCICQVCLITTST